MQGPNILIKIDGKTLNTFTQFNLQQRIYDHHSFELVVGHDIIEELGSHVLENSKDWMGKNLIAVLGENEFTGIVTSVRMVHFHGMYGDLIISGYSPTIKLEAGPHKCSWNDKPLKNIVQDTADACGLQTIKIAPTHKSPIEYIAQYRETHYQFLKRIATTYHEWLYYDGENLNFGKPAPAAPIPLIYGTDMDNVQISMQIAPLAAQGFSYISKQDQQTLSPSPDSVTGLNELGTHALGASLETFSAKPKASVYPRINSKFRLDEVMKNKQAAAGAQLMNISGQSSKMALKPGAIVNLKAAMKADGSWLSKPYGEYLITNVHHQVSGNYEYSNHFEAIPSGLEVLPEPMVGLPVAEPQIATVLSNDDPDKQGRVQVQFLWQDAGMKSPWVRVMTPDAGKSDLHPKNRGHVFIPEVGDQVMVGFRYNDPQRPFVMGSLYHGVTGKGGEDKNVIKSIVTRSGHELVFDDTKGAEKIVINDKNGNVIKIDTSDDSISMSSLSSINLTAPTISLLASNLITMNAGNTLEAAAGLNLSMGAGAFASFVAGKDAVIQAGKMLSASGGKNVKLGSGAGANIELEAKGKARMNSTKELDISSKESTMSGSKKANILSKKTTVQGSSKAIIKGSKVDIS